jgi:hypothetical protein
MTLYALATLYMGLPCLHRRMPFAVFHIPGWYPVRMQPCTRATTQCSAHPYSSLSALKLILSMPGAFLTACVNKASRTCSVLTPALVSRIWMSSLSIAWCGNACAMKISSFSSAVAVILSGWPLTPATLIAGVYDGTRGLVYWSACQHLAGSAVVSEPFPSSGRTPLRKLS